MLTLSSHLLHMPRNLFQEDLLQDFPRNLNEAVPPIVSQIILLSFSEDGCNICLSSVVRDLLWSLWLFKAGRERPCCKDISQPSQLSQMQPIWSHGLVWAEFLQVIPVIILICCLYFSFSLHRDLGDLVGEEWGKGGIEYLTGYLT